MRELAELFKGFADPTRLDMLVLMSRHGELCVCDFEGLLGLSQSAASRHLRRLYQGGLADSRRDGAWVYYRLRAPLDSMRAALLQSLLDHSSPDRVAALDQAHQAWVAQKGAPERCHS